MDLNAVKEIVMQVAKNISGKMGEFAKDFREDLLNEYVKNDKWKDTSKKFLKHKIDDYLISNSHKEQEEVSLHNIHPLKFELLSKRTLFQTLQDLQHCERKDGMHIISIRHLLLMTT